jgi:acyl dehydratase
MLLTRRKATALVLSSLLPTRASGATFHLAKPSVPNRIAGRSARWRNTLVLRIGQLARRTRVVTERDIELFTEMTGDRNPLHYDKELASRSRFGGLIVQGGVTTGLLNALVAEDLPGPGSVFLHVDWSFKAPVRPGDEITAEVEVLEARADKPITRLRTTITNQDDIAVLEGTALVYTEPL